MLTLYGTGSGTTGRSASSTCSPRCTRASAVTFYSRGLQTRRSRSARRGPGLSVAYPPVVRALRSVDEAARGRCAASRPDAAARAGQREAAAPAGRPASPAGRDAGGAARPPGHRAGDLRAGALRPELGAGGGARHRDASASPRLVDNEIVADYAAPRTCSCCRRCLRGAAHRSPVEAPACGTPVVSAGHPGGVELHGPFGADVGVVPREDSASLAAALSIARRSAADAAVHGDRPRTAFPPGRGARSIRRTRRSRPALGVRLAAGAVHDTAAAIRVIVAAIVGAVAGAAGGFTWPTCVAWLRRDAGQHAGTGGRARPIRPSSEAGGGVVRVDRGPGHA